MPASYRFSDAQIEHIIDEGLLYMCACPAQVAQAIQHLRQLDAYQQSCLREPGNDDRVHTVIAQAAQAAHKLMEDCMEQILRIEGWDRATLTMPPGLRQRQRTEVGD